MEDYGIGGLGDCWETDCPSCHPEIRLDKEIENQLEAVDLFSFSIPYGERFANLELLGRVSTALHDRLRDLINARKALTNRRT